MSAQAALGPNLAMTASAQNVLYALIDWFMPTLARNEVYWHEVVGLRPPEAPFDQEAW